MPSPADAAHPSVLHRHWPLIVLLLAGIAGPWFIFLRVASEIREKEGFAFDEPILRGLHAHATPMLDKLGIALAVVGGPGVMIGLSMLIAGGLALRHHHQREAAFFALAMTGALGLNLVAKQYLGRARPHLWEWLTQVRSYSFPSGHAMGAAALAVALGILAWRTPLRWLVWSVGSVFALLVGLSRVYLGVHYPSDVLAGWLAATGWVWSVYLVFSRYRGELRVLWDNTVRRQLSR